MKQIQGHVRKDCIPGLSPSLAQVSYGLMAVGLGVRRRGTGEYSLGPRPGCGGPVAPVWGG